MTDFSSTNSNNLEPLNRNLLKYFYLIILTIIPTLTCAQDRISGIVYGDSAPAKFIKITNTTQKIVVHSNEEGAFRIPARSNDRISFTSTFFEEQTIVIQGTHFTNTFVIQLKNKVNELDDAIITNTPKAKEFKVETYNTEFQNQIAEDVRKNPELYNPPVEGIRLDKALYALIKLLKRKKKKEPQDITYLQFENLFRDHTFFNEKLLTQELLIPKEYHMLFFEFCDTQALKDNLLLPENKFLLLNELVEASKTFRGYLPKEKERE